MKLDTALIVMGMHRSGTSSLTRVLSLHGFDLPETLIPPGAANERGFWESPAINALNNQILESLGQSWFSFEPVDIAWKDSDRARRLHQSTLDVLGAEFRDARNIVLKDPRICRVADFWMDALARIARRTAVVFIVRNPIEVAGSLNSRNEFDPQLGKLLWLRYYLDAEAMTRGVPRCFVNYEDLLADWRVVIARVRDELSLDLGGELNSEVDSFLASDLRHLSVSHASAIAQISDFPWLSKTYQTLHRWGDGHSPSNADATALDEVRSALDRSVPAFSSIVESARLDQKRLATFRQNAEERDKVARAEITATLTRIVDMTQQAATQRATIEARLSEATHRAREREEVIKRLRENLDEERGRADALAADIKAVNAKLGDAVSDLKAARGSVAEFEDKARVTRVRLAEVQGKYKISREKLARAQRDAQKQATELSRAIDQIRTIERTLTWRVRHRVIGWARLVRFQGFQSGRKQRKRLRSSAELIRASSLFDAAWYLEHYPDVGQAKAEPAAHYAGHGWREGRDPGPDFSTSGYLRANPDVAARDVNPLLHFLEHGQSEGRSAAANAPAIVRKSQEDFGTAHPCPQFSIATPRPVRWVRAGGLADRGTEALQIGGIIAGHYADDAQDRDAMHDLTRLFQMISGGSDPEFVPQEGEAIALTAGAPHQLIDAWFTTGFTIRSRWRLSDQQSFVLRAFQWQSGENPPATLVGEGLITGLLDSVDLTLIAPFSPILIVECEPEGVLRGVSILPFPSLCRGGPHYGELLALADKGDQKAIDLIQLSRPLATDLMALKVGRAPLISAIQVDLRNSDGAEPIFRTEFQTWLRDTLSVPLLSGATDADRDKDAVAYLQDALGASIVQPRAEAAFRLYIRSDELPTIQILTALKGATGSMTALSQSTVAARFVLTESNPSAPKYCVEIPPDAGPIVDMVSRDFRSAVPMLVPSNTDANCATGDLIATIRLAGGRPIQDAELLMPIGMKAAHILRPTAAKAVIAILSIKDWDAPSLVAAIEALSRQKGAERVSVLLLGTGTALDSGLAEVCGRFFPSRWSLQASPPEQGTINADAYILWIGQNIVLHDPRTIETLAALVERDDVLSAGCTIVRSAHAKKGWATDVSSAGVVQWVAPLEAEQLLILQDLRILPRAVFPVAQSMDDLWMARSEQLGAMHENQAFTIANGEGYHVCASLITAALVGDRPDREVSGSGMGRAATRVRVLLG